MVKIESLSRIFDLQNRILENAIKNIHFKTFDENLWIKLDDKKQTIQNHFISFF